MSGYVPNVPGVPAPMSYGQGYGNWQQYAGFGSTKNPYGGSGGFGVQPEDRRTVGIAPTASTEDLNIPKVPEEFKPDYGMPSSLGSNPQDQLGLKPSAPLGLTTEDLIKSHFGG